MLILSRRACLGAALPALPLLRGASGTADVRTAGGKVRGAIRDGVHIFRGIPYGGPTEGPARWLPPAKPPKWTGVRDCTVTGPRCVQKPGVIFLSPMIGEYFGGGRPDREELARQTDSENCLVLNVLTPGLRGKRPVMVYIHGGGFVAGSSALTLFSDRHVREQDVVLVGVNHRLSVFGYGYLGGLSERYRAGNVGQLDLLAALEWVRANIAEFGGDPANVTVFGESGGAAKINALLAMPAAKGLFHKACVQSGSVLKIADAEAGTRAMREAMAKLGVTKPEQLRDVPAPDLFRASSISGPVVDGVTIPAQTWDPAAPALAAEIPMIIGNCKDETSLTSLGQPHLFSLDHSGLRAGLVDRGIPAESVDALLALYRRDHPRDSPSDLYFRITTDRGERAKGTRQAELQLAQARAKLFVYYFQWNTPCAEGKIRSFHTADLPLTMRLVRYPESEALSRQLSAAWAAFARSGDPGQKGLPWPAYDLARRTTMVFDGTSSGAVEDPDREERIALRKLPEA